MALQEPPSGVAAAPPLQVGVRRRLHARLDRFADGLYGYDVFISYRRKDGMAYARALSQALETLGYSCFLDSRDYKLGEPLAAATERHCRKATVLVLLCTPAITEHRDPDWVQLEIDAFLSAKVETEAKLIPIGFNDLLSSVEASTRIRQMLGRAFIWQTEASPPEAGSPTPSIVESVVQTIGGQRRDLFRKRFFRGLSAVLMLLLLMASGLAVGVALALRESEHNLETARQNLAQVYMIEAQRRLGLFDVNGANAFAAAALTQDDRPDARRLIVEHPFLDIREPMPAPESFVAVTDYDAAHDRFAFFQDGTLWFVDSSGAARAHGRLGMQNIQRIAIAPDGSTIAVEDERGSLSLAPVSNLVQGCSVAAVAGIEFGALLWLDPRNLLVSGSDALYLIEAPQDCAKMRSVRLEQDAACVTADMAMDRAKGRVFLVDCAAAPHIRRYSWSEGSLRHDLDFAMPTAIGGDAPMQPTSLAWLSSIQRLAVGVLGEPTLLLLKEDFAGLDSRDRVDLSRFADEHRFLAPRAIRANPTGDRLTIADSHDMLTFMNATELGGTPLLVTARIKAGLNVDVGSQAVVASLIAPGGIQLISTDPPDRRRLMVPDYDSGAEHRLSPMALSPNGKILAVMSNGDVVHIIDTVSGKRTQFSSGGGGAGWMGFDPSGMRLAVEGDDGLRIFTLDGQMVRREARLNELSPTGFSDAAWLSDGSAVALISPWHGIVIVPVQSAQPASVLPDSQMLHAERLLALPGNRLGFIANGKLEIRTPGQAGSVSLDLSVPPDVAIDDIAASPDGGIAVATRTGLRWTNVDGKVEVESNPAQYGPTGDKVRITADGRRVALIKRDALEIVQHGQAKVAAEVRFDDVAVSDAVLAPDGSRIYVITGDGSLYSISLSALDEDTATLAARIGARVGYGQPDLTISAQPAQ